MSLSFSVVAVYLRNVLIRELQVPVDPCFILLTVFSLA